MFKFNIGSAVNGNDKALSADEVRQALYRAGFKDVEVIKTAMSDTETTYVVVASGLRDSDKVAHWTVVYDVCEELQQDAIAYKVVHGPGAYVGFLVGPKAEDWGGEFNEAYFID